MSRAGRGKVRDSAESGRRSGRLYARLQAWRWGLRPLLFLAASVVSLAIGEVIVRVGSFGNATMTRGVLHAVDEQAGWVCRPFADLEYEQPGSFRVRVKVNSRGLRDREHAFEKPEGVTRIVCAGDSFMWGYGVEQDEMFSARLEQFLPGSETINLGANGYSTVQELIRLECEGMSYEPDWVVLAFCWNDLEDNLDFKRGGRPIAGFAEDGSVQILNRPVQRPWKNPLGQWFQHHSKLHVFVDHTLKSWNFGRRLRDDGDAEDRTVGWAQLAGEVRPQGLTNIDVYGPPGPKADHAWAILEGVLEKVRDLSNAGGARLLVLYEVDLWTANLSRAEDLIKAARSDGVDLDSRRLSRRLAAICERLDVGFLDSTPLFQAHPDPDSLFLKRNMHWSASGTELVARDVARWIRERSAP